MNGPEDHQRTWRKADSRRRRALLALAVWGVSVAVFALVAGREKLAEHTPFNHYAHLADAWIHGRQDLRAGAPAYAQNNDFAVFAGKTYISFPPFPAVLMLPLVALAGSPEEFRDGQFIVWISGVAPAVLFLVLEKLRLARRSRRSEGENLGLSLLFAFGSAYFFTAVQGHVWYAAHVVGTGAMAIYVYFALDAASPLLAGLALACAWTSRPGMMFAAPLFLAEAWRISGGRTVFDARACARRVALFAVPLAASFAIASWTNWTRFRDLSPLAFGHEHLTVVWHDRIARWGLAGYHYLAKNLGVALTSLPWLPPRGTLCHDPRGPCALFRVNEHGLALWFTTPLYLWLIWPKRTGFLHWAVLASAAGPIATVLLYQNSGWRQFAYRFSNDYSVLLFVLLAVGDRSMRSVAFRAAAVWSVAWNLFGAVTFDRAAFDGWYFREGSQTTIYQPD